MSKREQITTAVIGLSAIVGVTIFLPTFFSVVAIVGLIWFVIARGNGYRFTSYLALIIGIILLVVVYPFDQSKGDLQENAKELAISALPSLEKEGTPSIQRLGGDGNDSIFLVVSERGGQVALARASTSSVKTYSLDEVNTATKEKTYNLEQDNKKQNDFMLNDFKESFPLKYGPAFVFFLLPLILIASLPGLKKQKRRTVFDSRDGKFITWLLPAAPSEDARGSVGAAGTQVILVLTLAMAISFILSAPSLGYFF